jgi:threonylcarbamoyladenosine tRNA methylthiotransferase MtaB
MPSFSLQNFGCRATEADACSLRRQLLSTGLNLAEKHSHADIVVLNTCTVTAAADAQAREAVRKIHRANPSARIVVTGCYAQRAPEELTTLPGVHLVVGNSHFSRIPEALAAWNAGSIHHVAEDPTRSDFVALSAFEEPMSLARGPAKVPTGDIFATALIADAPLGDSHPDRTRPILKVQDGCNHRCSYCVIPFVRGRSRSLPPGDVIQQVRRLVGCGAKEIVLSGINLGSYGRDLAPRSGLPDLVGRILSETELERLRFSSVEPQDVTRDFVQLVASSARIASHFHVPLQSGSDRILKAMRRWYRAQHYAERIQLIRGTLPYAGIGADVIAGFPGEMEKDFAETVELIEKLPFTYLHVFSFSPRPGTEGAQLGSQVAERAIRERARTLRAIGARKSAEFRKSQSLRRERALTLNRQGSGWTECLTGNYLSVRVAGHVPANQWVDVQPTGNPDEITSEYSLLESKTGPQHSTSELQGERALAAYAD